MRIIAGEFRGRRLKTLSGLAVRPTSDKLRETLFNVLRAEVPGSVFIDCYAGSGAVGLEAVSRGASQVFLIESDTAAARCIGENMATLGVASTVRILRSDVRQGLRKLAARSVQASICFLDPPYVQLADALGNMEWVVSNSLIVSHGLIVLEQARKSPTPERLGSGASAWTRARQLLQGSSALSFYGHPSL